MKGGVHLSKRKWRRRGKGEHGRESWFLFAVLRACDLFNKNIPSPHSQELSNGAFAVLLQHRKVWGRRPKRVMTVVACQHFKDPMSTELPASPGTSTSRADWKIYSKTFAFLWKPRMLPPVDEKGMSNTYPEPRFMLPALRTSTEQIRQWQDWPCSSERTLCRLGMWVQM